MPAHRARTLILPAAALTVALGSGCDRIAYYSIGGPSQDDDGPPVTAGPGGGAGEGIVTRRNVLETASVCAVALYGEAATLAATFAEAADVYAETPNDDNRAAAREAWKAAIGAWQQAEVLRVGPAGPTPTPSGQGLRDYVYSWPLVSRCLVDQTVVNQKFANADFGVTALINVRGFAAAEYLLFYEPQDNGCSADASINASGAWGALVGPELEGRRRRYAAVVAGDVAEQLGALKTAWSPDGGDFAGVLASAGKGGSPFSSDQAALNALSDGLFYLEKEVKDLKLARPLGKMDCAESSCPGAVESQYALVARDHVKNNILGFRRVFEGCDEASDGFDGLLRSVGAADVAADMSQAIEGALLAADALSTSDLVAALSTERDKVEALHASVKKITDLLKTDFVTILDLEKPSNVEGDND